MIINFKYYRRGQRDEIDSRWSCGELPPCWNLKLSQIVHTKQRQKSIIRGYHAEILIREGAQTLYVPAVCFLNRDDSAKCGNLRKKHCTHPPPSHVLLIPACVPSHGQSRAAWGSNEVELSLYWQIEDPPKKITRYLLKRPPTNFLLQTLDMIINFKYYRRG